MNAIRPLIVALLGVIFCGVVQAADDDPKPGAPLPPDPSRAMIVVDVSPKYAGAQKTAHRNWLERFAGITPDAARQTLAESFHRESNFDLPDRSFVFKIVSGTPAAKAVDLAQTEGYGTVVILSLLRRNVSRVGEISYRCDVDCSIHMKTDPKRSWKRLLSRRLHAESEMEPGEEDYRLHDTDLIARQVGKALEELMLKHATPHRVKAAQLNTDPRTLTLSITNNARRSIVSLDLAVPVGPKSVPLTCSADKKIEPGQRAEVEFRLPDAETAPRVIWPKAKLAVVRFEGGEKSQRDARGDNFRDRMRNIGDRFRGRRR